MPAGEYVTRLRWLSTTRSTNPTTGQEEETHVPNGYLWCAVEELNGRRTGDIGATQTGVDVEIRVNNSPGVRAQDLLQDEYQGYVYHVEMVRNGDNEEIVDGYRNDVLVDYDIEEGSTP